LIGEVKVGPPLVTSLAFGGPELNELYVTSCYAPLAKWSDHVNTGELGGHTFRLTSERDNSFKGTPMYSYRD
jgi:sugar lactone lactonase YvrE